MRITIEAGARLSTPEKAAISRKHKVQTNPDEKKRNVRGTADPNVSAWDRLNQFKGEHLTVVTGKSRSGACKETVCKKKSSVSTLQPRNILNQRTLLRKARKKTRILLT